MKSNFAFCDMLPEYVLMGLGLNNEIIFLIHISLVVLTTFCLFLLGKEALVAWVVIQALLSNLFVLKQIKLFGLNVTASDAFAVGGILALNFLGEYFGKDLARKTVWISFFVSLIYLALSQLHLFYSPSVSDFSQASYSSIFSFMPRIVVASLFTYLIVDLLDTKFFAILRDKLNGQYFIGRVSISLVASQFLDTALFSILGLYGIVSSLGDIFVMSFFIKLAAIAFATLLIYLIRLVYEF